MHPGFSSSSVAEAEPPAAPGFAVDAAFAVPVAAVPVEAGAAGAGSTSGGGSVADAAEAVRGELSPDGGFGFATVVGSGAGVGLAGIGSDPWLEPVAGAGGVAGVESDDAAALVEVGEFGVPAGGAAVAVVGLAGAPAAGVEPAAVADPVAVAGWNLYFGRLGECKSTSTQTPPPKSDPACLLSCRPNSRLYDSSDSLSFNFVDRAVFFLM